MYACGKEKEPAIVQAVFTAEKGNNTVVVYDRVNKFANTFSFA